MPRMSRNWLDHFRDTAGCEVLTSSGGRGAGPKQPGPAAKDSMKRSSILGLALVFVGAVGLSAGCTRAEAVNHGASASRSCTGSGWIPAGVVRDDPLGKVSIYNIATAMSDSGAAVVTWYEAVLPLQTGNSDQLFASVCYAGSWTAPAPLGSTSTIQSVLAARADGTAMAAWAEMAADSSTSIWVSTLDPASATWGPPVRVSAPGAQGMPSAIAMGDDGTAMIVWDQDQAVWAGRFDGSTWEAPGVISAGPNVRSRRPLPATSALAAPSAHVDVSHG